MQLRGVAIGKLFGVEIRLDPSLLIIFLLIVASLALGALPAWHPDWPTGTRWAVALGAGVLFLGSILLHELAHALVARAYGLPVRTITLFLFGGVANIEEEPRRPGMEFWIAIVGPLTSLAIGVAALALAVILAPAIPPGTPPEAVVGYLGPLATLMAWLGPINILLGLFNMLPGFPLDGGRVFRAAAWKVTGSYLTATRWASWAGMALGFLMVATGLAMAFGVWIPVFGTGLLGGIWLVLIGWFLSRLARWGYHRALLEHVLKDAHVGDLMIRDLLSVPPTLTVQPFVLDHLGKHDQTTWPVIADDRLLGIVRAEEVEALPREQWPHTALSEIMIPAESLPVTTPDRGADEVFRTLAQSESQHVAVEEEGQLVGLVRQLDVLRWLRIHGARVVEV